MVAVIERELAPFDESAYEKYFGGKKIENSAKIYAKCAEVFLKNLPPRLAVLEEAIQLQNPKMISETAHQLKGGFRTVGGVRLAQICCELEESASTLSSAEIKEKFSELKKCVPDFEARLMTFLASLGSPVSC